MTGIYYCRPSDILTASATVALTSGTADTNYPLANLYDLNPAKPFKATGTACTIRFTFGGATTLQAIAIITHNLVGATVTLTNNGGMAAQSITIPADSEEGLSVDPFKDLRAVANNSATIWTLTITGAGANVAIGEVLLVQTLRQMKVLWGAERSDTTPARINRTAYDVGLIYPLGVRTHRLKVQVPRETYRLDVQSLVRDALGIKKGFLVVPDLVTNDAYYMRVENLDSTWTHESEGYTPISLALVDVGRGPGV